MNNEHIYRLFLFSDVSNEHKSSSDPGRRVLIGSLAPRGKCDGVRASQVTFQTICLKGGLELNCKEKHYSLIHSFVFFLRRIT